MIENKGRLFERKTGAQPSLAIVDSPAVRVEYADSVRARTIEDWTSPNQSNLLTEPDTADISEILPGFTLQIREWFSRVDQVIDSEADSTEN